MDRKTLKTIIDLLPHGSGINGDWSIEEKTDCYECSNFYQAMNENGYYDGFVHFMIKIWTNGKDWELEISDDSSVELCEEYDLFDYLESEFIDCVPEILELIA
jgi:hypothetical protein